MLSFEGGRGLLPVEYMAFLLSDLACCEGAASHIVVLWYLYHSGIPFGSILAFTRCQKVAHRWRG